MRTIEKNDYPSFRAQNVIFQWLAFVLCGRASFSTKERISRTAWPRVSPAGSCRPADFVPSRFSPPSHARVTARFRRFPDKLASCNFRSACTVAVRRIHSILSAERDNTPRGQLETRGRGRNLRDLYTRERANFTGLILGCIEADLCNQMLLETSRRDLYNTLLCAALQTFIRIFITILNIAKCC